MPSERPQDTARQVAAWSRKAREATQQRDALICRMRSEGATLRNIAIAAGMTAPGIQRVLDRATKAERENGASS